MGRCPTLQLYSWPNTGVTCGALTALPRLLLGCHANDMLSQRRGFLERPPDDRQIVEVGSSRSLPLRGNNPYLS